MSSMEKERASGKKREKLGALSGHKVLETKKEIKKRRLILSDSESDDGNCEISPRDRGPKVAVADQVENGVNGVDVEVKSDLGFEVAKQIGSAEGDHRVAGVCQDVDGSSIEERSSIDESAGKEKTKVEPLRGLSSEVVEESEETESQMVGKSAVIDKENSEGQSCSRDEIKVETAMASMPADVKMQEVADREKSSEDELMGDAEMGLRSVIDGMHEVADTSKKSREGDPMGEAEIVLSSVVDEMQEGADTVKKFTLGKLTGEAEMGSRSVVAEMSEGAGIIKKPMEDEVRNEDEVCSRSFIAEKQIVADRMKKPTKDEIKGEAEISSRSPPTKKQEGADRSKKSKEGKIKMEAEKLSRSVDDNQEEVKRSKKLVDVSGSYQNGSASVIKKNNNLQRSGSEDEMKLKVKKVLSSHTLKEREGVDSHEASADAKMDDASSCKKDGLDRLTSREKLESNNGGNSKVVNGREESGSVKKRVMDSGSDKKRSWEALDDDIALKKFRLDLMLKVRRQEPSIMGTDKKSWERDVVKSVHKRRDTETDHHSKSKLVASSARRKDISSGKRIHVNSKRRNEPESENGKTTEQPPARKTKQLKDDALLDGVRTEEAGISQQKGVRVQSKTGILRVLQSDKVNGLKTVHTKREDKLQRKGVADQPSLSEKDNVEKPITTAKSGRNKLNPREVSLTETTESRKVKAHRETEPETSSPKVKLKNADSSKLKSVSTAKGEVKLKSKASDLTKLNTIDDGSEKKSTVKQRIRDQIKDILLNAGWRIELKPRRGRPYEDSVYVPPTGGSGFWSITKAYAVYLNHNKSNTNEECGDQSHEGTSFTFATIPPDLLQMLTRNVVNKRRSNKEIKEAKKKLGGKGKRKGTPKVKDSKKSSGALRKNDNDQGKLRKRNTIAEVADSSAQKLRLSTKTKKKKGRALLVRRAKQDAEAEDDDDDFVPYIWKRTVLSWMIDLGIVHVDEKVKYMNKSQKRALLEGSITRDGIRCGCCSKIISISKFEIHAGSKLDQPYQNIIVETAGKTLLQCQLDAWEKQKESERQGFHKIDIEGDDPNDDTCGLCGDGGDLICCDSCPSTFHLNCLGLQMLPPGDWHCTNCSCRYCGSVSNPVLHGTGSAATLLTCSQCEKKYHDECSSEADAVCSSSSGTLFCGQSCKKVFKRLQKLIGTKHDLEAGLSWRLVCCFHDDSPGRTCSPPQKAECNSKIAVAFSVMDECFRPIIDQRSGINLIHNVVYNCGSNINRLSYTGFYTFILERGDEIISVASVRIHGTRLAEMPFIGTRDMYRRQGMCRQLLNGIESALRSLNVEKLIIPAISELTETWTSIFGFKPLELSQKQEVKSINMLVFPGTGLLRKQIFKDSTEESLTSERVGETGAEHKDIPKPAIESAVLSHSTPKTCSPAEVAAQPEHELESVEPILRSDKSSDADGPLVSEIRTLNCKSSEAFSDVDLSIQPTEVFENERPANDEIHVKSSHDLKIKIPSEDSLHENYEVESVPFFVALENPAAVDSTLHATVFEDPHMLQGENGSSVCSGLHSTDEVVAHPNTRAGDAESFLPTSEPSVTPKCC